MKYSDRHISDEELDQLFRDAHASEGQESLFAPEFWSEMEALLPAEKTRKRGLYWIPVAATAVLMAVLLFYPGNEAQISTLNQTKLLTGNESDRNENSFKTKNLSLLTTESATTVEKEFKTTFRTSKKRTSGYDPDQVKDFRTQFIPPVPYELVKEIPKESKHLVKSPEMEPINELDSIHLEPRNERIVHQEIAALPKKRSNESNQWYLELGPTIGQSPYLSPDQKRSAVGGAILGGGYTKRIDNAFVSFGLQARLEGFGGLEYRETNFSQNIVRTVSVKQLYSLEIPLKFGYVFKRSEFSFGVVPGVQLFIHGKEKITENQIVRSENSFTGKVEHSNSLTMEFGFQYYYNFSSRFSAGAKINADILRPFHTDYYLGKSAGLPVNGQIVLRRTISKQVR
jgi:hypothetical protein